MVFIVVVFVWMTSEKSRAGLLPWAEFTRAAARQEPWLGTLCQLGGLDWTWTWLPRAKLRSVNKKNAFTLSNKILKYKHET